METVIAVEMKRRAEREAREWLDRVMQAGGLTRLSHDGREYARLCADLLGAIGPDTHLARHRLYSRTLRGSRRLAFRGERALGVIDSITEMRKDGEATCATALTCTDVSPGRRVFVEAADAFPLGTILTPDWLGRAMPAHRDDAQLLRAEAASAGCGELVAAAWL